MGQQFNAGLLRHVVKIQRPVVTQDDAGQQSTTFEDLYVGVRAQIVPLSGREFVAASQVFAEMTTRMTIRWLPGIDASCRVIRSVEEDSPSFEEVYDIKACLPDPVSGVQYMTLMCIQRFAEGWRRGGN